MSKLAPIAANPALTGIFDDPEPHVRAEHDYIAEALALGRMHWSRDG